MLLFDLDGTIVDSNGIWLTVDKTFLARRGAPYTQAYRDGVAHTILQNCAVFTKAYLHLEESCEEIIAEWMELAKDAYANVELKPGVRAYLDRCRAVGERMAVFTASVPAHCQTALRHHRLEGYFEKIIYAQELGEDKNTRAVFQHTAALLGVTPEECVLFDDSLAACKAAKAAGMSVVGVRDDFFQKDEPAMRLLCDRFIENFTDLT